MKLFVDTNVLVYAANTGLIFTDDARRVLRKEIRGGAELYVSTQVLREFAKVMTGYNYAGIAPTLRNLDRFERWMKVLPESAATVAVWKTFVARYQVRGKNMYDCNLAATVHAHGVTHILTHNVGDFQRYSDILTVVPMLRTPS